MKVPATMHPTELLRNAHTVLLIDWPSKQVPETLARAGFEVHVHGGPGPTDYSTYQLNDSQVIAHPTGHPPEHADFVYSYRPLSELPDIIALATRLRAKAVWMQSGLTPAGANDPKGCWLPEHERESARRLVHAAQLSLITEPYILDTLREIGNVR